MLTCEDILAIYKTGPEAVIFVIQRLETIIEKQAIRIDELEEHGKLLESHLNQNSRNSNRPPSTDFFVKEKTNPKSRRIKSDKKTGGQEGHLGTTLDMVINPDQEIEHSLHWCEECGCSLENMEVENYEIRQVIEKTEILTLD